MTQHTTALSTAETDRLVDLLMPAGHAAILRAACNTKSKMDAKAATARAAKTAACKTKIEDAIHAKRPALEGKHRCFWTSIILRYFARHGIEAPDIETVRAVVKGFSGF